MISPFLPFPPPTKIWALPLFHVFEASYQAQPHPSLRASSKFLFISQVSTPAASRRGRGAVEAAGSDGSGRGLMDTALRREVGGILHSSIPPQQGSGFSRTNTCDQAEFVGTCPWGLALSKGLSHQSKNSARDQVGQQKRGRRGGGGVCSPQVRQRGGEGEPLARRGLTEVL